MRVAHISDLHLASAAWSPFQFFSKRWLGNFNFIFSRRGRFDHERIRALPDLLEKENVGYLLVTGDLSTTSRKEEFSAAKGLLEKFEEKGTKVIAVPGNHDQYTRSAYRNRLFYDYFPSSDLQEQGVAARLIANGWWVVALDTALATSWVSSRGLFSKRLEKNLEEALSKIPEGHRVVLMNHFPFFQHISPRKTLAGAPDLEALIRRHPNISLYLHGHTHIHCVADLQADGLPIVLDSGSTPLHERGRWNLIDLNERGCSIEVFSWSKNGWQAIRKEEYVWAHGIKTV